MSSGDGSVAGLIWRFWQKLLSSERQVATSPAATPRNKVELPARKYPPVLATLVARKPRDARVRSSLSRSKSGTMAMINRSTGDTNLLTPCFGCIIASLTNPVAVTRQ